VREWNSRKRERRRGSGNFNNRKLLIYIAFFWRKGRDSNPRRAVNPNPELRQCLLKPPIAPATRLRFDVKRPL